MPDFGAALSEHPDAVEAIGEVVGEVLEQVGEAPDLAVLFATAPHGDAFAAMGATVLEAMLPGTLVGASAVSVLGGGREVEEAPAVSLWAGRVGPVVPVQLEVLRTDEGIAVAGLPPEATDGPRTLLLLPDPFTFPADGFLEQAGRTNPDLQVVGGLASGAMTPGGNRLLLDGQVHTDGAVGVLFDSEAPVEAVVSQGCRPIGSPAVITRGEGNLVYELAGRPAMTRLQDLVTELDPDERALVEHGLHVGIVIDERKSVFERGDFLVRNLLGVDRQQGAVAIGDVADVGTTVQFHVRDAGSADEDLRELMAPRRAEAALVFTCNGRGTHLFGQPDHDAQVVSEQLDGAPVAGMFCAGELGPVGGRNFLHGFTASVVLFGPT